jgi:uncharacterized protein YcbK (DUF882 family)
MLKYKEPQFEDELLQTSPKLQGILYSIVGYRQEKFQADVVITSVIRKDNPDSLHYYGRALDIRVKDWTEGSIEDISNFINRAFPYGKEGLVTAYVHGEGINKHIHLQVINRVDITV